MTRDAVVAALEEVRPYLQADGGDVEIVGVEDGYVSLRLEGACRCGGGEGLAGSAAAALALIARFPFPQSCCAWRARDPHPVRPDTPT
jgi:hypothetical protein